MLIQMSICCYSFINKSISCRQMKNKKDEWNPNFVSRTKTMNALVDDIKKNK